MPAQADIYSGCEFIHRFGREFIHHNMRHDKIEIYIHLIWTTWDRTPWLTPDLEAELFAILGAMFKRHNALPILINGVPDHVHCLVKFSSTTLLCDMVKDAKGVSSRWANERLGYFKWRPTYAAFSVSRWDVPLIRDYIANQKEHHGADTTNARLEGSDEDEIWDGIT